MVIETRAVAGAAYRTLRINVSLTHAVRRDGNREQVLCGRVKLAHLLDDVMATNPQAEPTCKACAKAWRTERLQHLGLQAGRYGIWFGIYRTDGTLLTGRQFTTALEAERHAIATGR